MTNLNMADLGKFFFFFEIFLVLQIWVYKLSPKVILSLNPSLKKLNHAGQYFMPIYHYWYIAQYYKY